MKKLLLILILRYQKIQDMLWHSFSNIQMPCLILRGQISAILSKDTALTMSQKIKHANLINIPKAGHAVMTDNPQETIKHLLSFLQKNRYKHDFWIQLLLYLSKFDALLQCAWNFVVVSCKAILVTLIWINITLLIILKAKGEEYIRYKMFARQVIVLSVFVKDINIIRSNTSLTKGMVLSNNMK